jgi:hypothetical protein
VEGRVTEIARLREPIGIKRSGLAKESEISKTGRLSSPGFREAAVRLIQYSGGPRQTT